MIRLLHPTAENLVQNVKASATGVATGSGMAYFGIEISIFLQIIGVGIAFMSMIIGGLYYWALIKERKRSNRAMENQRKRELDILEGK